MSAPHPQTRTRRRRRKRAQQAQAAGAAGPAVSVYRGRFGAEQAERLLWRAGFGPRPGEAEKLARKGLDGAVQSLTRPRRKERLGGPPPQDQDGHPLAPADAWGHDHLWWLDRMVRTNRPLTERMTLVWHDWFATSNEGVGSQRLMIHQNEMLRKNALGSFRDLVVRVTRDPAMLLWLSGAQNREDSPNENYARELMELFTLGAGPRLHRGRRARAGARADRLPQRLGRRRRAEQLSLRPRVPRRRREAHLRQEGPLRVARLVRDVPRAPEPPVVLRREAVVLLHPGSAGPQDPPRAAVAVRARALRGAPGGGGDPAPPRLLRGAAHGEAAGGLPGGPAARLRPLARHRVLDLAVGHDAPAPVRAPERRRAGRTTAGSTPARGGRAGSTASHVAARTRGGPGQALRRDGAAGDRPSTGRSRSGGSRRCRPPRARGCSSFARARRRRRRQAVQAARLLRVRARTPSACWWPPPPTCRRADGAPLLRRLLRPSC